MEERSPTKPAAGKTSNVLAFRPSPLSPFLGKWSLDPLSVSRNKVVKRTLGDEGLKKLWAFNSMQERAQYLETDPELAERYRSLLGLARASHLVITMQTLTFDHAQSAALPPKTSTYSILNVTREGLKVIVNTIDMRPELRGRHMGFALRMNKQWLLVSERYSGRAAQYFPRSPVFRYYASA